jgi:hypothetical protein
MHLLPDIRRDQVHLPQEVPVLRSVQAEAPILLLPLLPLPPHHHLPPEAQVRPAQEVQEVLEAAAVVEEDNNC